MRKRVTANPAELPFQRNLLGFLVNGAVVIDQAEALAVPEPEHEDRTHNLYSGSLSRRADSRNWRASSTVHEFRRCSHLRDFGSVTGSATLPCHLAGQESVNAAAGSSSSSSTLTMLPTSKPSMSVANSGLAM
jgi:hypothetical protein